MNSRKAVVVKSVTLKANHKKPSPVLAFQTPRSRSFADCGLFQH